MNSRQLEGHDGDLYDRASDAYYDAILQLRALLLDVGFVADPLRDDRRQLQAYPVKIGQFPRLKFAFVREQQGAHDDDVAEFVEISVVSKGLPRAIDARLREIVPDDRCTYYPRAEDEKGYRVHGSIVLPLTFHGASSASTLDFTALREPLHRVYRALAFGESVRPPRAPVIDECDEVEPVVKPPLPVSYVVPGTTLFAGEYPGGRDEQETRARLAAIVDAGVKVFVDLTNRWDELDPYDALLTEIARDTEIERHRIPLDESDMQVSTRILRVLDTIDSALRTGMSVYVHCWGGVGRTGTIIGCWLGRHGRTGDEALALVDQLFRTYPPEKLRRHPYGSPETENQRWSVRHWAEIERRLLSPEPLPTQGAPGSEFDDLHDYDEQSRRFLKRLDDGTLEPVDVSPQILALLNKAPKARVRPSARDIDTAKGCLLGGAVGDALGAPVEFVSWPEIQQLFGADGIQELAPAYGRVGAITDDTQMTLWTADGVLRELRQVGNENIDSVVNELAFAYLRWLYTQDGVIPDHVKNHTLVLGDTLEPRSWLLGLKSLHARRAPGETCLTALRRRAWHAGAAPINDSKGSGAVMRVAPIALIPDCAPEVMLKLACGSASITHGHPTAILAAGALVLILASVRTGVPLDAAVHATIQRISREPRHEETAWALQKALHLGHSSRLVSAATTESLGSGWTAESALAIGVYAAMIARDDFARGVRIAVNHSGDSDTTGSIAGQLLGIQVGMGGIPTRWLQQLELRTEIEAIADDLTMGVLLSDEWRVRYIGGF